MFKLLLTAGMIWLAYKFFFAKPDRIEPMRENPRKKEKEGDFVDYEELE